MFRDRFFQIMREIRLLPVHKSVAYGGVNFSLHRKNLLSSSSRMSKCFRFLSYLGLASVCNVSYGMPYPSLQDIELHLNPDGQSGSEAFIKNAFRDVCQQAEASGFKKSGFKKLKLIGEKNRALTLPNGLTLRDYRPQDYRDWQWKFDTIYGFFSCTVNDVSVFNEKTLRKAVMASEEKRLKKKMLLRSDTKKIEEITKICQVLLSEEFAKKLLTERVLRALYDNKDAAYSCFDIKFSPHVYENVFRFDVVYSQIVKDENRKEKGASVFAVWFHFGYNIKNEKQGFGGKYWDNVLKCFVSPQLECLQVDGECYYPNDLLSFNEHMMERVWRHPFMEREMCSKGKEKILREEKGAVDEEERENSEKSKKVLGSEEEEEEEAEEASEFRDPKKRPRSLDPEDKKFDRNFKKKKQ